MLGFYGAVTGLKKSGYVLLLDIGGGSTEFILGSYEEGILFSESIDVGALRMTEKFITNRQTFCGGNKIYSRVCVRENELGNCNIKILSVC